MAASTTLRTCHCLATSYGYPTKMKSDERALSCKHSRTLRRRAIAYAFVASCVVDATQNKKDTTCGFKSFRCGRLTTSSSMFSDWHHFLAGYRGGTCGIGENDDLFLNDQPTPRSENSEENSSAVDQKTAQGPSLPQPPNEFSDDYPPVPDDFSTDLGTRLTSTSLSNFTESQHEFISEQPPSDLLVEEEEVDDTEQLSKASIVYRFFGRKRVRNHRSESLPFLLLGPCVDHWKSVGLLLASRGFDVMACEIVNRQISNNPDSNLNTQQNDDGGKEDTVISILDALRWKKAVLVGCDQEAELAIRTALRFAPERIAGLVLCGELSSVGNIPNPSTDVNNPFSFDTYLASNLGCPFEVIWDGDMRPVSKRNPRPIGEKRGINRCMILGGGISPHRRLPEQFSWVLTRFVEDKVAPRQMTNEDVRIRDRSASSNRHSRRLWSAFFSQVLGPSTSLVAGRIVARAILFTTALRVSLCQYENARTGLSSLKCRYKSLSLWRKHVIQSFPLFFHQSWGSWPRLFLGRPGKVNRDFVETKAGLKFDKSKTCDEENNKLGESQRDGESKRKLAYLDRVVA